MRLRRVGTVIGFVAIVALSMPVLGASCAQAQRAAADQIVSGSGFKVFSRPTRRYTRHSCVIDLSKYHDSSLHRRLRGCGTTVRLSSPFMRLSAPGPGWGPWSCPPYSESCTPDIMYSNHVDTATIDFGTTVNIGGFEYGPALFQVEQIKVSFFTGPKGSGTLVGTIIRNVDGHGGARLFAARSTTGYRSVVVTNDSDDQFALAQIRVQQR